MEIISLTPQNGQKVVEYTAAAIKSGKVVVSPTDTVYGLLADATNEKSVSRLYKIKRRDVSRYLPIFVKNMAMARKLAVIKPGREKLLEEKWPGKFTFIFNRKYLVKIFGIDNKTVALRIPSYPFVNSLLETLNIPLTGTSANISGQRSSTKIDEVIGQFINYKIRPDLIINAGDLPESNSSAIIDITGTDIKFTRK
jgi:L-threonylcarbamoyladenylate synthase